jgi:hypothetical protein
VIGIDTPEVAREDRPGACYGDEARAFARTMLEGRTVRLTFGVEELDRFGRTLATVQVLDGPAAGRDLSLALAAAATHGRWRSRRTPPTPPRWPTRWPRRVAPGGVCGAPADRLVPSRAADERPTLPPWTRAR